MVLLGFIIREFSFIHKLGFESIKVFDLIKAIFNSFLKNY